MAFRDRLAGKAASLGQSAYTAGNGFRGVRAMFNDDGQPLSIERFLLVLIQAVRDDGRSEDRSTRDVYVRARKRRRNLGFLSFGAGPFVGAANQLVDLYCETAIVCDLSTLHDLDLGDEHVAAHMLVLWKVIDDFDAAHRAASGEGFVAGILATRLRDHASERLPDQLTKRSIATALWDARDAIGGMRGGILAAVKAVIFSGHRTKKFIKRAEVQLGVE